MFDLIAAWQQVMMLMMAAVFMAIGGLLLGADIHTRVRGVRVTGTIVGVRETRPNLYRNVYHYALPSGQSVEATSNTGSSSARGRETGRRVQLFAFADRPSEVCEAGVPIAGLFGALFFTVGLWPLHTALTHWRVTALTALVLVAMVAYLAYRARTLVTPKAQRNSLRQWIADRRREQDASLAQLPVRPIEEVLATPGARALAANRGRQSRWATPLLVIVGVASLGLGVHLGRQLAHREASGQRVTGTVVSLVESSGSDRSSYYPLVRFTDADGSEVRFKDDLGSNPPSYSVGEAVTVLYVRGAAAHDAMIDRGLWNWLPTALLALFGSVLVFAGLRGLTRQSD